MNKLITLFAVLVAAGNIALAEPKSEIFTEGEFFVGCNYWARNAGMYMWSKWEPQVIEKELGELAKHGVTVMRVFPLWPDFQPLTADCDGAGRFRSFRFRDNRDLPNEAGVDDDMVSRFSWFCKCAERHGIKLIVGLITGHMSGRRFMPEVFSGKNPCADPSVVAWQTRFVKYLVNALKDEKAIAAWDLGNECNCFLDGVNCDRDFSCNWRDLFYNWMEHIGMAIRLADPTRPIVSGMHGLSTDEQKVCPIRLNGELMDVLCTHPYPFYVPGCGIEAFNTMRTELHPTAESLLYRDLGGKPCFIEEIGNLGAGCVSDARSAAAMRCVMFSAWANDLKGCLWWCNSDQEGLDFPPYMLTANERELGILRKDYSPKPVMLEMEAFQKFRASLPFKKLPLRKTNAVIVVPEKDAGWPAAFGAYLLCRQAGIDPMFAGAERELPDAPLYVVCSASSPRTYTYRAQRRVSEKAREKGATVFYFYGSQNRFTAMREISGLEPDFCARAPIARTFEFGDATIKFVDTLGTSQMIAHECEVLAKTANGLPMFTRFKYGKGWIMVVNAPLDRQAVERTDVVQGETIMPYYRLLMEVAKTAGIKSVVEKGACPFVGITEHPCKDGSTIVMAINFEPRAMKCPIKVNGKLGQIWRGKVSETEIDLPANEAALFEVR